MLERVQPTTPTLRYVEIFEELRRRIEAGEYRPGERLPSQLRLADEFRVALLTLRQALQLLDSHGYLYRKSGSGTYVKVPQSTALTALVVDDEESVRAVLGARLRKMGWTVEGVGSGEEALRVLERARVDLVFLDLAMPGMDGAQTFQKVRELDGDVPVAVVTGYPDSDMMARALRIGPFAVIHKPFRGADIDALVKGLLGVANGAERRVR